MEDLYNRLLEQNDKEAKDVALGLEIFCYRSIEYL